MIKLRLENHKSFTVYGKKTWISGQDNSLFGRFWEVCHTDGTVDALKSGTKYGMDG